MGRVINPNNYRKERQMLLRSVALTIRKLMRQEKQDQKTRDFAAYLVIALNSISKTIDPALEAWEKRGYWLKADRYRLEWQWTDLLASEMEDAVQRDDWSSIALVVGKIAEKIGDVKIPKRNNIGTPWVGAWGKLMQE